MKTLFTFRRLICMQKISSLISSISECYIKRYLSYSLPNSRNNTIYFQSTASQFALIPFQVLLIFRAPLVIRWYDAEVSFCSRNEHALKRV